MSGAEAFPFGYHPVKVEGERGFKLFRHEETSGLVREIVTRLIDGESQLEIATDFNERGVPTPYDYWDAKRNPGEVCGAGRTAGSLDRYSNRQNDAVPCFARRIGL